MLRQWKSESDPKLEQRLEQHLRTCSIGSSSFRATNGISSMAKGWAELLSDGNELGTIGTKSDSFPDPGSEREPGISSGPVEVRRPMCFSGSGVGAGP